MFFDSFCPFSPAEDGRGPAAGRGGSCAASLTDSLFFSLFFFFSHFGLHPPGDGSGAGFCSG